MGHQQQHWQNDPSYYGAWNNQYNYQHQPQQLPQLQQHQQQQYYDYNQQQQNIYYPLQQQPYSYPPYSQHTYPSQQQQYSSHAVVHQLHAQTQQRQALGAIAAASIASALQKSQGNVQQQQQQQQQQQNPYTQEQQQLQQQQQQQQKSLRSAVNYHDLASVEEAATPTQPQSTFCCNRWYRTAAAKAQHAQSHIQCTQCEFAGIKAIIEEHQEVEHGIIPPGGSSRKKNNKADGVVPANAPKIRTPEELAAWIEARKKNWPSQANVERKEREKADRTTRGQLETTLATAANSSSSRKKRKREGDTDEKPVKHKVSSMDALVGTYASADDDSDGSVVDLDKDAISSKDPASMGKIALPQINNNKPRPGPRCKFFARGNCKHGDQCRYVHEKPSQEKRQQHVPRPVEKRPNLLRQLLAKEIREEQNVILQCFRHIVDQQFFGRSKQ